MNALIEQLKPLINLHYPTTWVLHAIDRSPKWTDIEKEQAMRYVIRSADIGETTEEEITVVPLTAPSEVPAEPSVPTVPAEEPVPA